MSDLERRVPFGEGPVHVFLLAGGQGMAALWGAATKKIIGAGVDSPRLARDLATLIGQHDVPVRSINYGEGWASESVSLRRQDILEPAAIRALPPGTALLLATGAKPALIHLTPWHAGPRAAQISAAQAAAQDEIRAAANQVWPAQPDHGRASAISPQETSP
jgi:type IV secretory pathway TraG/TraD family ATPase VirD4